MSKVNTEINENELAEFYNIQNQLAELKVKEMEMRKNIFAKYFPEPVEGAANKQPLNDGFVLQATHTINRSIDKAALTANGQALIEANIPVDDLVEWKPSLKKSNWNKLSDEQKQLFAPCITEREGSPKLEIKKPKRG